MCACVQVASSARYIIKQFRATTGCAKIEGAVKSTYAAGRMRMAMAQEPSGSGGAAGGHEGCFMAWQLMPDMWLVEMAVARHAVATGCDGRVAWRPIFRRARAASSSPPAKTCS